MPDPAETCRSFDDQHFLPGSLHRFVVGVESAPRQLSTAEVAALGDPFAALLARGTFPGSAQAPPPRRAASR